MRTHCVFNAPTMMLCCVFPVIVYYDAMLCCVDLTTHPHTGTCPQANGCTSPSVRPLSGAEATIARHKEAKQRGTCLVSHNMCDRMFRFNERTMAPRYNKRGERVTNTCTAVSSHRTTTCLHSERRAMRKQFRNVETKQKRKKLNPKACRLFFACPPCCNRLG